MLPLPPMMGGLVVPFDNQDGAGVAAGPQISWNWLAFGSCGYSRIAVMARGRAGQTVTMWVRARGPTTSYWIRPMTC